MRTAVLVDARNVLRSRWPNIPDAELIPQAAAWAEANGLQAAIVFDGEAPGRVVGERAEGEHTVVGSGAESADDWIARRAAHLAAQGESYWLVTSDRALRARAGAHAERTIGGGRFAQILSLRTDAADDCG